MSSLVIVESPTKAKTITKFLGKGYKVRSSFGHIRDLPKSKMGIDIKHGFAPEYSIPARAKKVVDELKKLAKTADKVYLATDEDREGEAISWHLVNALKLPQQKIERIVFHEITKSAIKKAILHPRKLDINLVDAQQARRVLDRLVGYELSPFLWKKIKYGLSAGRVQSVALRLIVDREKEIKAFKADEYWTIEANLEKTGVLPKFVARLVKYKGKALKKLEVTDKKRADGLLTEARKAKYKVERIKKTERKVSPHPPFTTSTLQQAAAQQLGYSAKQTMMLAQQLYEGISVGNAGRIGLITYMRTDSVNLATQSLNEAKKVLADEFGKEYASAAPRAYKTKSKSAQEAHEAIRPTSFKRNPTDLKQYLDPRQHKIYDLIWRRALASQMPDAILDATSVEIGANDLTLRVNGLVVKYPGFQKLFDKVGSSKETRLPALTKNDSLKLIEAKGLQHFTQPPARFSDASLIKTLEELGIGRPSTYAPTLSVIQERGYVDKEEKKFIPTDIGMLVTKVLVQHFPKIVDFKFTSGMEADLDKVARGETRWTPIIKDFYTPFHKNLVAKDKEVSKEELTQEKTDEKCEKCGKPLIIKIGRFGKFMACSGYPDCKTTKPLKEEQAQKDKLEKEHSDEKCPECGKSMQVKRGRFGPFLGCSDYPNCKGIKPIENKTGAACPQCKKGDIIEKRSRKGRTFYACNQYPECEFALWQKPTGENCPECKNLLVFAARGKIKCTDKACTFEKDQPDN